MPLSLRQEISALFDVHLSLSAWEIVGLLGLNGIAVQKRSVNTALYGNRELFHHDGDTPPNWSLRAQRVYPTARSALRVATVEVSNWKVFESQSVSFGGITLLYGANSAGKSSIFKAVLAMKQSWGHRTFPHEGRLADLGPLERLVHRHELDRVVSLSAAWGDGPRETAESVTIEFGPDDYWDPPDAQVRSIVICVGEHEFRLAWASDTELDQASLDVNAWTLEWLSRPDVNEGDEAPDVPMMMVEDDHGFPQVETVLRPADGGKTPVATETLAAVRTGMQHAQEMFDSIEYIGPFRTVPDRRVTVSWAEEHEPYLVRLLEDEDLVDEVNEWLFLFETPYVLHLQRYEDGYGDITFGLELDHSAGERVQLHDVGFGLSQLLPMVVHLLASREKTILLEEPEAHLHPRLQSVLGDLLLLSAQDYGNVILAETHSEPILLRLQRRIAEGRAAQPEIAVKHVVRAGTTSEVVEVPIGADGQLDYQWPGGFFDDRMDDLVAILDPHRED